MKTLRLVVLIASCASLFLHADRSAAQSPNEEAVKDIERQWDDAWNRHDPKALAALLSEDTDFVNVTAVQGKRRLREANDADTPNPIQGQHAQHP